MPGRPIVDLMQPFVPTAASVSNQDTKPASKVV